MRIKRKPKKLELGKNYYVGFSYKDIVKCKFIQTTKSGFNFLNLQTNKCILKHHLYRSKYDIHSDGNWFWVNQFMIITECSYVDIEKRNGW